MKNSSNLTTMEQVFETLAKIKKVEPNTDLHARILDSLLRKNSISLFWVKAVACLWIAVITTEFYIVSTKENTYNQDNSILIPKTNNNLYNE